MSKSNDAAEIRARDELSDVEFNRLIQAKADDSIAVNDTLTIPTMKSLDK